MPTSAAQLTKASVSVPPGATALTLQALGDCFSTLNILEVVTKHAIVQRGSCIAG